MKIALLSHSYHQVTKSADFLAAILMKLGSVTTYFDESWDGRQADWVAIFEPRAFDCIVILQAHECFKYVNADHPNIVFVPMYDAMIWHGAFYWQETFNCAKVLCFSSALHQEVAVRNSASAYFQYYPDPGQYPKVLDYTAPRGYYWRRRNEIGFPVIERLTKGFVFEQFTLHDVPDPGSCTQDDLRVPRVNSAHHTITGWHASEQSYLDHLSSHNIYFAPRLREGIGFGFLKAMSMGLCVVAPNTGTHNEYIAQGCTGVLYDPDRQDPADLRHFREMGCRARESMERGHRRWEAKAKDLLEFLAVPKGAFSRPHFRVDSWIDSAQLPAANFTGGQATRYPSVAVVTVCLNARTEIAKTIRSVIAQDYQNLEYVILDGGSADGTIDVIREYESALAFWTSSSDGGVYPAMQKSLRHVKSDWVLFMNAGDFFISADALTRLFSVLPPAAEVVCGHHVYRHTNEIDELRLASDFGWMWARLQEGQFDVEYPVGFPAHQAIAVRTQLLKKLKFDPLFLIAADHDLLWRAWRRGVKFFAADEVITVYVGGGFSAKQMERCKREWCVIALRYGPRRLVQRFRNCSYAEADAAIALDYGYRSERFIKRLRDTAFGRIPGIEALGRTAAMTYLWAARMIYLDASLCPPLLFTRKGIPAFLSHAHGLSEPEEWGSWSEGDSVQLVFREPLPASFTLVLHLRAFGPNSHAAISVTAGAIRRKLLMKGSRTRKYRVRFGGGGFDRITFSIPYPTAPAELECQSKDRRRLGLGFVSMRIESSPPV